MSPTPPLRPRIVVKSIGGGLLLMAFFTMMWADIAQGGLQGSDHCIHLAFCSIFSLVFIINGIRLLLLSKQFPKFTSPEHQVMGKQMGRAFGIIFGIEGLVIPAVSTLLALTQHAQYILPAIALVVGLHFYPMARIFRRTIDYYLATWTCLVALAAIYSTFNNGQSETCVMGFLGIGVSLATISYGLYMLRTARKLDLYAPIT
jgi:hypothetical protein